MRVLVIGDVGVTDETIHVGDEAMFEELVVQLRRRGVESISALSSAPADTRDRYGVEALPQIGFRFGGADARDRMSERMRRVVRAIDDAGAADAMDDDAPDGDAVDGDALAPDDPAHAVIAAVRASDAVILAGGGNLASTWPLHIFERATLGEIARRTGTPLFITGQTLGPALDDADAWMLGALLDSARLVGVRESASAALALDLGVEPDRLASNVDDASFLGVDDPVAGDAPAPFCLVTISTYSGEVSRDELVRAVALLLDEVVASTGLEIVFSAHFGSTRADVVEGDAVVHAAVAAAMTSDRYRTVAPSSAVASAALARSAGLVLTSRYHPAVFAASAGVPTIGIPVDAYTRTKLAGALENGAQSSVLPLDELVAGGGAELVAEVWAARAAIRRRGLAAAARSWAASQEWWDRLVAGIRGR